MKVGRYLMFVILGGIVGGLISLLITGVDFQYLIHHIGFMNQQLMVISCIIVTLCIVGLTLWQYQIQKAALKLKSRVEGQTEIEETDILDHQANMKFLKVSVIVYVQYLISFVFFFVLALGNKGETALITAIVPFLFTCISATMVGLFQRKFDRRFPKLGEAKYTEKAFQIMDEGERYITLVSLYKVYHMNLTLIIIGVLLLSFFSLATGMNQFLGILFMIVLFAYNAFGYLWKVSRFYRE
ncbi:DUF3169 family protein [Staphylococcus intermedius]|uniref:Membrane protein n=1 Tax=Staphylococcus intermedius NCTC 11048 TaxID=1141106 RepID=A0A380G331_STAIN|nr:DUF3169 family protein [Staphylococcus intermedius]PCF78834.1 hypothetical protein B4W74_09450 [Staphylococcus intermedius]PCF89534.1 hypothetical protein B4W75_01455 [Staphylococcus intermedius]PNZ54794.1 DUF3169 domain-containing protein [Staphylococcus intermedius NCTC 11048]SUM45569.1 membrane protein [Staphylococcus intermedius NCTC 11048]